MRKQEVRYRKSRSSKGDAEACYGVGKSIPTSLVSPKEASKDHEKPFHEDESNVSKEMSGIYVTYGSGGSRRSIKLHNIKVCQQKK
ncbi:hypothetical protein VNO77_23254 [Canavalia gladiata]|uniref:Uncharacterized protein n=1 Tax=Canavalia gladiata TaxID=3824 RepID=A0AAN9L9C4_CANGL